MSNSFFRKAKAGHEKLTCTCKTVSEQAKEEERNVQRTEQLSIFTGGVAKGVGGGEKHPESIEEPGKDINLFVGSVLIILVSF